jgi:hypothetical protein
MIGAGVLTLPAVFQRSGVAAAFLCLLAVATLAWLLQAELLSISDALTKEASAKDLETPLIACKQVKYQWDLPEIVRHFLGDSHWLLYFLLYYMALSSTMSAYANMTGTAVGTLFFHCDYAQMLPELECAQGYKWGLGVYLLVVCCLTVLEYKEQAWLQTFMTILRFGFIIFLIFFAIFRGSFSEITLKTAIFDSYPPLGVAISTLIFASVYHMCTPSIIYASNIDSKEHNTVAMWVALSTIGIYGAMGMIGLLLPGLQDNISLLFSNEMYGYAADSVPPPLRLLNLIIIFIPVIDVCTNSPIYGQSLSGIVTTCFYGPMHSQVRIHHPVIYKVIRCAVVVPPVLMAAMSHKLVRTKQGPVISLAGNFNAVLVLVYIPLCYNVGQGRESKADVKWKGIEVFNYLLAGTATVFFFILFYSQLPAAFT